MTDSGLEDSQDDLISRRTVLRGAATTGFFGMSGLASADEWQEITFSSVSSELFEYRLTVAGELKRGGTYTSDNGDEVSARSVQGRCTDGRSDSFLMKGEIVDLTLSGPGKVVLDGQVIRDTTKDNDGEERGERRHESQYVLVQGDTCVPIQPLSGRRSVETFYDYELPAKYASDVNGASSGDTARYASAGTRDLQRSQTSIAFLYRGTDGLSLVFVHGSTQGSDGGAVTLRISGLPANGRWVVKDDHYGNSNNFDQWSVSGTDHRIDWTWGSGGTDGGAFHGLDDDFDVLVHPAFNEQATLYNQHYEGTVTDWEFLSGSTTSPERISLELDEPLRIKTGSCGDDTG